MSPVNELSYGQRPTIVLYEDDTALADEILRAFTAEGHEIGLALGADELRSAAQTPSPSVLIMDRMIHNADSLAIVEEIRAAGSRKPVMVISSLDTVDDRIEGLRKGGDDYLVKPFVMGELIARVEAMMRRLKNEADTKLVVGDLAMDVIARSVRRATRTVTLAPREFALLEYLMRHQGQIVTRAMILEDVWKYRAPLETNVVDVHMSNLRRKVDMDGEAPLIRSKRGLGFMIAAGE